MKNEQTLALLDAIKDNLQCVESLLAWGEDDKIARQCLSNASHLLDVLMDDSKESLAFMEKVREDLKSWREEDSEEFENDEDELELEEREDDECDSCVHCDRYGR